MPARGSSTTVGETLGPIAPPAKPQRASASARRANPRDHTGRQKQVLEAQHAGELAEREAEMARATAAAQRQRAEEVVDYSKGGGSAPGMMPGQADVIVEDDEIEVEDPVVTIRVVAPIEDMVFGREVIDPGDPEKGLAPVLGNLQFYNFEEGRPYRVPAALAKHLASLDYLV